MRHPPLAGPLRTLAVVAALAAAGCTTTTGGSPSAATAARSAGSTAPAPGPAGVELAELAELDLTAVLGSGSDIEHLVADGSGGAWVWARPEEGTSSIVHVVADGSGLTVDTTIDDTWSIGAFSVHPLPDGRLLIHGNALRDGEYPAVPGLLLLDPATGTGPVLDAPWADNATETALSPDGGTLYGMSTDDPGGGGIPSSSDAELVAVDVETGEVRDRGVVELPGGATVHTLTATPDGDELVAGLTVLGEDDGTAPLLLRLDTDLRAGGDPVELAPPEDEFALTDLAVTGDGTAVVLATGYGGFQLSTVTPGGAAEIVVSGDSGLPFGLAVDPAGTRAHLGMRSGGSMAVDLGTGAVGDPVELCADPDGVPEVVPAPEGSALVLFACEDDAEGGTTIWLVGPR